MDGVKSPRTELVTLKDTGLYVFTLLTPGTTMRRSRCQVWVQLGAGADARIVFIKLGAYHTGMRVCNLFSRFYFKSERSVMGDGGISRFLKFTLK